MPLTLKGALLQAFAYILWLVSAALCVVAVIELRSAVNVIWAALGADRYTINVVNQVSLLLGGLTAFIYVLFLEGYYRESVQRGALGSEAGGTAPAQTQVLPPAADVRGRSRKLTWQWLGGAGLSALMRRFAITIAIPLGVLALCLALREIALAYR